VSSILCGEITFLGNSCDKSSANQPPSRDLIQKFRDSKSFCRLKSSSIQSRWPLNLTDQAETSTTEPLFLSENDKTSCGFGSTAQSQKMALLYCTTFSNDPCCKKLPPQRNWQWSKKIPMGVTYSSDDSRYDSLFFGVFCLFMFSFSWLIGYSLLNTICVRVQRHRFNEDGELLSDSSLPPPYQGRSSRSLQHHPSNMSMQSDTTLVECPVYLHDFTGDSAPPARLPPSE
jgi:hypothetical protein